MSDLIKREDAIRTVCECECYSGGNPCKEGKGCYAVNELRKLPSADRPQGAWIDMGDFEKCSVCKATHLKEFQSYYGKVTWIKTPYCPQCGARMKGADDE